jgi:5-methylthioadenosine/S-adenosylhomocysteine deaminase
VRLDEWLMQPCFDPASHLVYAAGREQVTHTWVAGKLVMCNGDSAITNRYFRIA